MPPAQRSLLLGDELAGLLELEHSIITADSSGLVPLSLWRGGNARDKVPGMRSALATRTRHRIRELRRALCNAPGAVTERQPENPVYLAALLRYCCHMVSSSKPEADLRVCMDTPSIAAGLFLPVLVLLIVHLDSSWLQGM
jgi:hypothetical protein